MGSAVTGSSQYIEKMQKMQRIPSLITLSDAFYDLIFMIINAETVALLLRIVALWSIIPTNIKMKNGRVCHSVYSGY